jgi:5-methylcytosine-specific restriction endonuclease McrA
MSLSRRSQIKPGKGFTKPRQGMKAKRRPLLYNAPLHGSRRGLKSHLDRLVSRITLQNGKPCFVCGETDSQLIVCGHLFARSFPPTRFLLENCVPLCSACNLRHEDEPHHLIDRYIARYGRRAYDTLEALHWSPRKPTHTELDALAAQYEGLLKPRAEAA